MKVISLANQKGGVAKTTSSQALAAGLVMKGYRVLGVDCDPQSNFSIASGVDVLGLEKTLFDVFKGAAEAADVIQPSALGYDVMTGGLALAAADMEFTQTGREFMLREALEGVSADYDYCVIDTSPSLGIVTVNVLTASDAVIIPLTADLFSIQGIGQLNLLIQRVRKYSNRDLKISGLLITRHEDRTNVSKALMDQIDQAAEKLGTKVFRQPIRTSVAVRESQVLRTNLFTEAPKANAANDYMAFIDEFMEGENGK